MLYSCTHMATVGVKWLNRWASEPGVWNRSQRLSVFHTSMKQHCSPAVSLIVW